MNLMKRENFGVLREAVHTNNTGDILGALIVSCRETGDLEGVANYINGASAKAPYRSIATWSKDPATKELCDYLNKVNMSREPEDLGNLAYLIMSSDWCDEWLAFAVDVLGRIDVGTVNLRDALHWWCGHWRVLHQRILDAGWECEPRHVWFILSVMIEGSRAKGRSVCTGMFEGGAGGARIFASYPFGSLRNEWGEYETEPLYGWHSENIWWFTVRSKMSVHSNAVTHTWPTLSLSDRGIVPAQRIRGHK